MSIKMIKENGVEAAMRENEPVENNPKWMTFTGVNDLNIELLL